MTKAERMKGKNMKYLNWEIIKEMLVEPEKQP